MFVLFATRCPDLTTVHETTRYSNGSGVVGFKVSNLIVTRSTDSGPAGDKFKIEKPAGDGKIFKFANSAADRGENKLFWREAKPSCFPSEWVCAAFRFRFERVGKNFKPMKLFAVLSQAVALEAGKPRRVV
jgi:hypothetical protein